MRRSAFGSTRRRARKPRADVTMKEKVAKREANCNGCSQRILKGDTACYVRRKIKRYHKGCLPLNWAAMFASGAAPVQPIVNPLPTTPADARLKAMEALENALVVVAKSGSITPEMEATFAKYQKYKAHALRGSNDTEAAQGFRLAINALVKMVF